MRWQCSNDGARVGAGHGHTVATHVLTDFENWKPEPLVGGVCVVYAEVVIGRGT